MTMSAFEGISVVQLSAISEQAGKYARPAQGPALTLYCIPASVGEHTPGPSLCILHKQTY